MFAASLVYNITIMHASRYTMSSAQCMLQVTADELLSNLRAQSRGVMAPTSQYKGVCQHQKGKWEARITLPHGKQYVSHAGTCLPPAFIPISTMLRCIV